MVDVTFPILPVLPETGKPGVTVDFPVLPAPPMGDGRNGKREPLKVGADLFDLEQWPPRILNCKTAAALRELLQTLKDTT